LKNPLGTQMNADYQDLEIEKSEYRIQKPLAKKISSKFSLDDFVKSLLGRHPGERRGPEHLEITGFRLSPE